MWGVILFYEIGFCYSQDKKSLIPEKGHSMDKESVTFVLECTSLTLIRESGGVSFKDQ